MIDIPPITSFPPINIGGYKHFTPTGLITTGFNQSRSDDMFLGTGVNPCNDMFIGMGVNPCHINAGKMGKNTKSDIFCTKTAKNKNKIITFAVEIAEIQGQAKFQKSLDFCVKIVIA